MKRNGVLKLDEELPLILASSSPRRRELLRLLEIPFQWLSPPYEERFDHRSPAVQAEYLAEMKLRSVLESSPRYLRHPVLSADTVIDLDGELIGKAENRSDAAETLRRLSGRSHRVITALSFWPGTAEEAGVDQPDKQEYSAIIQRRAVSQVEMDRLTEEEIKWYLDSGEWRGAAGAYRIQGRAAVFIKAIEGCYYNIMGLPIQLFYGILRERGYTPK
ncbi:MAG TPA: septum formation protein Maf [Sediminispirochaeta sp.]|nr:septum formation protein Maf [Sediminispirochaeta sp.]